jgi:hypothetical protein
MSVELKVFPEQSSAFLWFRAVICSTCSVRKMSFPVSKFCHFLYSLQMIQNIVRMRGGQLVELQLTEISPS